MIKFLLTKFLHIFKVTKLRGSPCIYRVGFLKRCKWIEDLGTIFKILPITINLLLATIKFLITEEHKDLILVTNGILQLIIFYINARR